MRCIYETLTRDGLIMRCVSEKHSHAEGHHFVFPLSEHDKKLVSANPPNITTTKRKKKSFND